MIKNIFFLAVICLHLCLLVGCQSNQKSVETIIQGCQTFFDKDNLEEASNCIQKAMFANPEQAEEISKLGAEAFFKKCVEIKNKKDYQKSIICFEGVTVLMPNSANVQFNLADSYFEYYQENGENDIELLNEAEEAIKNGLEKKPDEGPAYSLYGDILEKKGNIRWSLKQHKKAVEVSPNLGILWTKLAFIQERIDRSDDAIKSYKEALRINPRDTTTLFFLGRLYEKVEKDDEAIETIEKQIQIEAPTEEILRRLKYLKEKRNSKRPKTKSKTAG